MKLEFECTYCGHKWNKTAYDKQSVEDEKCPKCKDLTLKVRDVQVSKIDYYQGSPPFPAKDTKFDSGWPWGMGGFIDPGSVD
jgi:5-methylcytosine-specific restriction endonuclease McrA